jgi:hypothetical protein
LLRGSFRPLGRTIPKEHAFSPPGSSFNSPGKPSLPKCPRAHPNFWPPP